MKKKKGKNSSSKRIILVSTMMICIIISMSTYWIFSYKNKYGYLHINNKIISYKVSDYAYVDGNIIYLKNIDNKIANDFKDKQLDIIKNNDIIDIIKYINKKNQDLIDEILKTLISKGKGIEINTSGYRYKEDRFYPCTDVVKRYFELGGEIITIGSDSHIKEYITMDFDIVYEFLKSIGVKYICGFDKLNPVFKKLK